MMGMDGDGERIIVGEDRKRTVGQGDAIEKT